MVCERSRLSSGQWQIFDPPGVSNDTSAIGQQMHKARVARHIVYRFAMVGLLGSSAGRPSSPNRPFVPTSMRRHVHAIAMLLSSSAYDTHSSSVILVGAVYRASGVVKGVGGLVFKWRFVLIHRRVASQVGYAFVATCATSQGIALKPSFLVGFVVPMGGPAHSSCCGVCEIVACGEMCNGCTCCAVAASCSGVSACLFSA